MEQKREVKTVQVDYKCPECKIGFLRPTGTIFATNPPQIPHKCNNCGYGQTFTGVSYPYIDYEPVTPIIQIIEKQD